MDLQAQQRLADACRADLHFLQHHSWQQIYERSAFVVQSADHGQEVFSAVVERLIGSRLGRDLIAHGFIDDYFALYVSMYYGRHLKPAALNFIVHALDRGRPDHSYPLEPDDVEAVLREQGDVVLTDRSAYNISILDHLLATDDRRAQTVIGLLSAWTPLDRAFANNYASAGAHKRRLVQYLTPLVKSILPFTLDSTAISEEDRPDLVDAALGRLSSELAYNESPTLATFVTRSYRRFSSLTTATDAGAAQNVIKALAQAGIYLPDVEPLNAASQRQLAESKNYVVTEHNLQLLSGSHSIALDVLQSHGESLHERALDSLRDYLNAVAESPEDQVSIADPAQFIDQIRAVMAASIESGDALADVIRLSAKECRIPDLRAAPSRAWAPLCAYRRTHPSASNVLAYLQEFETIDESVALLLNDRHLFEDVDLELIDRQRLAIGLLNARRALPSVQQRIALASSLDPGPLSPDALNGESGPLAGELLLAKLVSDDEEFFASHLIPDWPSRKYAIGRSAQYANFCSPATLPSEDVVTFFESTWITDYLKLVVLRCLREFVKASEPAPHAAAARFAVRMGFSLSPSELEVLAYGAADSSIVMELMRLASYLEADEILDVFRAMGAPYQSIADRDVKVVTLPHSPSSKAVLDRLNRARRIAGYRSKDGQIHVRPR